jgi:hypothetical protein
MAKEYGHLSCSPDGAQRNPGNVVSHPRIPALRACIRTASMSLAEIVARIEHSGIRGYLYGRVTGSGGLQASLRCSTTTVV